MPEFYLKDISKIRIKKEFLQKKLNVKIEIKGNIISFEGDPIEEYEASMIFEAINFGFPVETALILKDSEYSYREIPIKDFTRKKNLNPVRARLIGKHGKTRETLEEIAGCKIKIKRSSVGIIGRSDEIEYAITAVTNLIKGSKQANVYSFLERINKNKNSR